jgi:glycosyltransferase involved in cell wall biosynthesis
MESLLQQDFNDFEVIAVDDGSTDKSGELCDQYARQDRRIHVFHQPNGGVTAARRFGVEQAQGRYIMFADSDDELLPHALQTMYQTIEETQADEVIGVYRTQHGRIGDSGRRGWQDPFTMVDDLLAVRNPFCILWGVIFRKELLDGCLNTPREVIEREDILMQIKCLVKRPKVFFIPDQVYLYNEGLPNNRQMGLERIKLHDQELLLTLRPTWQRFEKGYRLNRLKLYEVFLEQRQFDVFQAYYKDLRRQDLSGLPWADRLVIALPPRLACWPVRWYKWWLRRKSR